VDPTGPRCGCNDPDEPMITPFLPPTIEMQTIGHLIIISAPFANILNKVETQGAWQGRLQAEPFGFGIV